MNLIKTIKDVIKNIFKDINALLITILLSSVAILGVTNYIVSVPINYSMEDLNSTKNYVLNRRTLKIHKENCPAVAKMSKRNKINVNDSINNLTQKGYVICNRCRAGIKRQNEIVANLLDGIDFLLFGEEVIDLPTKEEYLKSIDEMGIWYVNNIPTYQNELQEEQIADYTGNLVNVKKYELKNKKDNKENKKKYNVITSDTGINIDKFDKNENILKCKEEAVINYSQNYDKISYIGNIACYPCEYLKDSVGGYNFAGDDCVRFMFSCLNNMDNRFVNLLSKYSKTKWRGVNTKRIANNNLEIQYAMQKMGFEIFDIESTEVDFNKDGYYEFLIKKLDSNFKLEKGDIITYYDEVENEGHIHFYLSEDENFGWGKVNRVYPQKSKTYIDSNTNKIICNEVAFTRVYRYIGNNDN